MTSVIIVPSASQFVASTSEFSLEIWDNLYLFIFMIAGLFIGASLVKILVFNGLGKNISKLLFGNRRKGRIV